jgi:hypothetical protein
VLKALGGAKDQQACSLLCSVVDLCSYIVVWCAVPLHSLLQALNKGDIVEIKSFPKPPPLVQVRHQIEFAIHDRARTPCVMHGRPLIIALGKARRPACRCCFVQLCWSRWGTSLH